MKKEELRKMIAYHESALQRAKRMLNERYYELEARGDEMEWLEEFKKQKMILSWLQEQTPDDQQTNE